MAQMEQMMMGAPEEAGRGTDTVLAHMSLGEVVIPRAFLDDPQVMQMLQQLFQAAGVDMAQYTVGDPANSINPETGYPEFFFKKLFKNKLFQVAAPLALSLFAPGIGTALGGSLLGAGTAGASTLGNALIGGGFGALSGGGLKSALTGAALSGIGANIGSLPGTNNLPWLPAGLQGGAVESGSGLLGALGRSTGLTSGSIPSLGGLIGGSSGGGNSFSALGALSSAASGLSNDAAIKKARKEQELANQQQLSNLEGFDPSGITSDPGYEFNRAEGERGLQRSLGAQGGLFSGAALKAASQYNQNYADNAFKDYYSRWADKTGAKNQIIGGTGANNAGYGLMKSNNISQTLSNMFNPNANKPWWMQSYA